MSATAVVAAGLLLAKSAEAQKAGPIWLAVVLILGIACWFLFKSMSKHLRIVRDQFPADLPRSAEAAGAASPAAAAPPAAAGTLPPAPTSTAPTPPPAAAGGAPGGAPASAP